MKCFEFGSIKRALRPHLEQLQLDKFQYINLLALMGKHDDFIKISYCIFKMQKPSIKFSMKSNYEKDLRSANTKSSLYICILMSNEPASSQEVSNGT